MAKKTRKWKENDDIWHQKMHFFWQAAPRVILIKDAPQHPKSSFFGFRVLIFKNVDFCNFCHFLCILIESAFGLDFVLDLLMICLLLFLICDFWIFVGFWIFLWFLPGFYNVFFWVLGVQGSDFLGFSQSWGSGSRVDCWSFEIEGVMSMQNFKMKGAAKL